MKILLTSVSAGSGHVRAADAVQAVLNQNYPSIETRHIDIMDYVPRFFKKFYVGGYSLAANRFPRLWGGLFYSTNKPNAFGSYLVNYLQALLCGKFLRFIDEFKPDLILTTHFLVPQILSIISKRGFRIPVHCIVTDFYAHQFWLEENIERYYVAQEKTSEKLTQQGVNRSKITVSGIPISPIFSQTTNAGKLRETLELESNVPTVLILSGGLGFGDLASTVKSIFSMDKKLQIITVSGKNAKLLAKLKDIKAPDLVKTIHFGYVTNMHELLSVTDIVVSKAGGLTVSECMVKGNGMLLYPVIPGQEEKNCEFMESIGAGVIANSLNDLNSKLRNLLEDPKKITEMKNNALKYSKPSAAITIALVAAETSLLK